MKTPIKTSLLALVLLSTLNSQLSTFAQGATAFTYQGRLDSAGAPVTGLYDLSFSLWSNSAGPTQVGATLSTNGVGVSNGLFTVTLDFGAGLFTGADRWLEIGVRTNGASAFATLSPRQPLTPSPYALYAPNAGTAALAGGVTTGAITSGALAPGSVTATAIAPGAVSALGAPDGSPTNAVVVNAHGLVGIGTGTNAVNAGLQIATGATAYRPAVLFQVADGMGSYTNLGGGWSVAVSSNLVAVAARFDSAVTLMDITSRSSPVLRAQVWDGSGSFTNLAGASGVAFNGNVLAVAAGADHAVTLISVTNPTNPVKLAELRDGVGGFAELAGACDVAFSTNNLLAVAAATDNAVTLVDVSNPAVPVFRGVMKQGLYGFTNLADPAQVAFAGSLLAIASKGSNAVTLVDISNPANPVKVAELKDGVNGFNALGGAIGLAFSGNLLAIAAESDNAVTLVDVSTPASPQLRSVVQEKLGGPALKGVQQLAFAGNLLTAAAREDSALTLLDVSDPAAPVLKGVFRAGVGGLDYLALCRDVAMAGPQLVVVGLGAVSVIEAMPATVNLATADYVGIGTAVPEAPLHVVGNVIVDRADRVELQATTVALGNSLATGSYATAMGYNATASGPYATAMGLSTTASGACSTATGYGTTSSELGSTAMGYGTTASASYATAMGYGTTASGYSSTAMGDTSRADGFASMAAGYSTTASGYASTAMGARTTASGTYSTALGYLTVATNDYTMAAGYQARANHAGTFVWADASGFATFDSTGVNQFLLRATGGVGINKNNPATALDVNGTVTATSFAGSGSGLTGISAGGLLDSSITSVKLANDTASLARVTGGSMSANGASLSLAVDEYLNDKDVFLRGDPLHGLGWYGSTKLFGGQNIDGPVLYGCGGGGLGTKCGTTNLALRWNSSGNLEANGTLSFGTATRQMLNLWGSLYGLGVQNLTLYFRTDPAAQGGFAWYRGGVHNDGQFNAGGGEELMRLTGSGLTVRGTFVSASDRNAKGGFEPVDPMAVLVKVTALPITRWHYTNDATTAHLGPVAQDFHAAFGVGPDDKHIATVDADGVALAAIQGLNQKVDVESARLRAEHAELKARLERLERLLGQTFTAKQQDTNATN